MIPMTEAAIKALAPTKKFIENKKMSSLSYSEDGNGLIVSGEDVILLYDTIDGCKGKSIECKKYGVGVVEYCDVDQCLHSSLKEDNQVRMLSLQKKSYVRYFPGHSKEVNCIVKHPREDQTTFLTSSLDMTVRVWDCRTFDNVGFLHIQHVPLIAYDPDGLIFAVATKNESIKLFDVRSFDLGPFKAFIITKVDKDEWTHMEFSRCGKFILISTKGGSVKWIDAFRGSLIHNFSEGHINPNGLPLQATATPDSQYVFVGSVDNCVCIYSTESGQLCHRINTGLNSPCHVMAFNDKKFLMTSLSKEVVLWTPNQDYEP